MKILQRIEADGSAGPRYPWTAQRAAKKNFREIEPETGSPVGMSLESEPAPAPDDATTPEPAEQSTATEPECAQNRRGRTAKAKE
jgi:hypothetical protein